MNKHREPRYKLLPAAVEETLKLYHAWLGYLLSLIQADTLRVKVDDISKALEGFSCAVTREGDEYVISITRRPCEPAEGSVGDPAPSEEESHE